jgi:hypothetical protein
MKTETASAIERKWRGANFPLVQHLAALLPEPDKWALYTDGEGETRLVTLTKRSVFVVWLVPDNARQKLALGRAMVTNDGDTSVRLTDTPIDLFSGEWEREWVIDFKGKPRNFPTLEFTGRMNKDGPDELEDLARAIAEKAGWTVATPLTLPRPA